MERRITVSIVMPRELHERIIELAKDRNISVSRTMENILRREVSVIPAQQKEARDE